MKLVEIWSNTNGAIIQRIIFRYYRELASFIYIGKIFKFDPPENET